MCKLNATVFVFLPQRRKGAKDRKEIILLIGWRLTG